MILKTWAVTATEDGIAGKVWKQGHDGSGQLAPGWTGGELASPTLAELHGLLVEKKLERAGDLVLERGRHAVHAESIEI
jgi:hypothetical protein